MLPSMDRAWSVVNSDEATEGELASEADVSQAAHLASLASTVTDR